MHVPKHFEPKDTESMQALIREYPLGTMVSVGARGLSANHIPFELEKVPSPYGSLIGHVARANPVWREVSGEVGAIVIFQGANAYISPSWYPSKQLTQKVVPTWNYVAVHAYGEIRVIEDASWLRGHVERLTNRQESAFDHPWSVSDAPTEFTDKMLGAIVGIEIKIKRLEGMWKASQNRSEQDREGVIDGLCSHGISGTGLMAEYVENTKS